MELITDEIVGVAAKALYAFNVKVVLEQAGKVALDGAHYKAVFDEMLSERSPRAVGITSFALFDDMLISAFSRLLNPEISGGVKSLVEGSGQLSTAHSRIKMAASLYWIRKPVYERLDLLRSIRNRFAHHVEAKSFDDNKIAGWLGSFPPIPDALAKVIEAYNGMPYQELNRRQRFITQTALLFSHAVTDLTLRPYALRYHVDAEAIDMNKLPAGLQFVQGEMARVVMHIALVEKIKGEYEKDGV